MSKNGHAPEIHMIGLVPDADGRYLAPNFKKSTGELVAFIQGRGEFLGMLDGQKLDYALVNITDPGLVADLEKQDFIARVPFPGMHKDMGPFRDSFIYPIDEEKIGVELTL
jgi:hypothetical protein